MSQGKINGTPRPEPATELWEPEAEVPALIRKYWPKEEGLEAAIPLLFPKGAPQGFGIEDMRGIANHRRKEIWQQYLQRGDAYLKELQERPD